SDTGQALAEFAGHTEQVLGAHELEDGRIMSWSKDGTLRIWKEDGTPLAAHDSDLKRPYGALELSAGRVLFWAIEDTIRLLTHNGGRFGIDFDDYVDRE